MATFTTDYTLADSNWLQVSSGKGTVIISSKNTIGIVYAVAATASDLTTANTVGHPLDSKGFVTLLGLGTANVFIKSVNTGGGGIATVTAF